MSNTAARPSPYGTVDGTNRALRRLGYGFYELFTFTCPTYRGTFKPPYERCGEDNRIEMNVHDGLSEFPPELGFETYFNHSRTQNFYSGQRDLISIPPAVRPLAGFFCTALRPRSP